MSGSALARMLMNQPLQDSVQQAGSPLLPFAPDPADIPLAPSGVSAYPIPTPPTSYVPDAMRFPSQYYHDQSNMMNAGKPNDPMNPQLQMLLQMMYHDQGNRT